MKIVFVGNCQAAALHTIYKLFVSPHTGDEVNFVVGTAPLNDERHAHIIAADIVVEQVFDMPQPVDLSQLSFRGKIHRVPVVGTPFLWPFAADPHPLNKTHGEYEPFRSEIGDSHLNRLLASGIPPDEAAERYLAADMAVVGKLDRLYEITIDRQRARDLATGYRCADLIEGRFRDKQLFLTPYHLTLTMSRYMALTFLEDIGALSESIDLVNRRMTENFYPTYATPVHPGIARHFGLKWANEWTKYPFHSEGSITFEQFVRRYVRCEVNAELDRAIKAVARDEPGAKYSIEAAIAWHPSARESPDALVALARVRMQGGLYEDAAKLLRRAIGISPPTDWANHFLSQCLHKLGDMRGAEAALREAIALRPCRHGAESHLAHMLADRGAFDEAIAAMRGALEFDPHNDGYLAKLAEWEAGSDITSPSGASRPVSRAAE